MSHVQNLQSFDKVIRICTGLGGTYNPGQQNLQVNAMTTQLNIAQQIWEEVKAAQQAYDNATNARELGFIKIRKLSSDVYNMLKVSSANELLLKDALNSKRRIWGARITKPPAPTPEAAEVPKPSRPSYGQAYVVTAEYFDRLVKTVASESQYAPNEPHLTVAGLQQTLAELFGLNEAVLAAETRLEEARSKRNAAYYLASENLVRTANAVRSYVRSVFGFQSQEHQLLTKLRFTKPVL
jgi:hypothetical protein